MRYIFLLLSCVLFHSSCKTTKNLSKVEEYKEEFVMPELKSTINLHYQLSKQSLQDTFNKVIDKYLTGDMELTSMDMDVIINKSEEASIELTGKRVLSRLPIEIMVSKKTIFSTLKTRGVLDLNFITEIDMDSSWNLVTKTSLEHYDWIEEPKLSLGIFSIPVGKFANSIIEKSKTEFETQIDKSVNDQLSLRDKVLDLLKYIEKPLAVDTLIGSWVHLIPEYVHMSEILNLRDWSEGNITVQGRTKITETEPTEAIPGLRLPEFVWQESLDDTSHINLVLDVSYDRINEFLNENYKGRTFSQDGKSVTVQNIRLTRRGNKLLTIAAITGSVNGDIHISGQPIFDNDKQVFYADNIEVNLKTKNVLHKAGAWLLKGKVKNQLKELMRFSIKDIINDFQYQIDSQISKYNIKDQLSLSADLKKVNVNSFVLGNEQIHSFLTLNLFLKAVIHDMKVFENPANFPRLRD